MGEKPQYCQTHQPSVDIPALACVALWVNQNIGKDSQVDVSLPCPPPRGRIHSL